MTESEKRTEADGNEGRKSTWYCKECGAVKDSQGAIHAHAETHRGFHGIQWPWNIGDFEALDEMTEEILVVESADNDDSRSESAGGSE